MPSLSNRMILPLTAALLCSAAAAEPATIVFAATAHAGASGKDAVPGLPGFVFTNFGEAYGSEGSAWVTAANVSGPGSAGATDQVVLVGNGTTFSAVAREGVTPVGPTGQLLNLSGLAVPRINAAGTWAIAFTPAGDTTSLVIRKTASGYETVAVGGTFSSAIGANYGLSMACASVLANGQVAFLNDGVSGSPRTALSASGATVVAREATTMFSDPLPTGVGGALRAISYSQASTTFFQTSDGAHHFYLCDIFTEASTIIPSVVRDGQIVMQVGQALPDGSGATISAFSEVWMEPNGDYFVKGTAGGSSFFTRNGQVIARVGSSVVPSSTETWTVLIDVKGDARGNYVVVGTTSASSTTNDIIVLNGATIISRESDPVDLNGDGLFNDSLFIHSFRDRSFMGNDGYFYIGARMKSTAAGTSSLGANVSMIRIPAAPPCIADFNQDGGVDGSDVESFFSAWENSDASADLNQDGGIDGGDVQFFFQHWESGC